MAEALSEKIAKNLQTVAEKVQGYEQNNVQQVQKEILLALYDLKDTLVSEVKEIEKLEYRNEHLKKAVHKSIFEDKEKEALVVENAKLKYRIQHLLNHINEISNKK